MSRCKRVIGFLGVISGRNYNNVLGLGIVVDVVTNRIGGAADRILNGRLGSHAKEEIFIGVGKNILVSANFGSCIHVGYIVSVYILIA